MLYTLLSDTSTVVEKIVGEQPKDEDSIKGYIASGLLEELNNSQNFTENYIQKLAEYNRLLCSGVYASEEMVECAVESR
jgi:hypothetical protein